MATDLLRLEHINDCHEFRFLWRPQGTALSIVGQSTIREQQSCDTAFASHFRMSLRFDNQRIVVAE
jgi:hypothetical protein